MLRNLFNSAKLLTAANYSHSFNSCEAAKDKEEVASTNKKLSRKERKQEEAKKLDEE